MNIELRDYFAANAPPMTTEYARANQRLHDDLGLDVVRRYNYADQMIKERNKTAPQKSGVPAFAACFFKDGDKWCCVLGDFINLQESPAGFGETMDLALDELNKGLEKLNHSKVE